MPRTYPPGEFPVPVVRTLPMGDARLSETAYSPGCRLPRHAHERACFVLVLDGIVDEVSEGCRRVCEPASVIFRPVGERHEDAFRGQGGRCLNVELAPVWLETMERHARAFDKPVHFGGTEARRLSIRLYREFRTDDRFSALAMEGILLELAAATARLRDADDRFRPAWLERARGILDESFRAPPSTSALAARLGIHPVRLARAFRRFHGGTVADYVRDRRVAFAGSRLAQGTQPLAGIALDAGFFDQSHFSRTFKLATGMTPGEYRAAMRRRSGTSRLARTRR